MACLKPCNIRFYANVTLVLHFLTIRLHINLCYDIPMKTLARFIQEKRKDLDMTQKGLAIASNLPLEIIEEVEDGKALFLSVTVRQALAKVLRCEPEEIKALEKDVVSNIVSPEVIESLKELILNGAGGLKCPKCGAPLETRIAKMYDLEDNLVLHPKAHCTKCPFQIHS